MTRQKTKQIAEWLHDRVIAGRTEEVGSVDYMDIRKNRIFITKCEDDFLVTFNLCPFGFTLTEQSTLNEIRKLIVANA